MRKFLKPEEDFTDEFPGRRSICMWIVFCVMVGCEIIGSILLIGWHFVINHW